MPGFTVHCPRCGSGDLKQVARNDRYPLEGRRLDTPPIALRRRHQVDAREFVDACLTRTENT